MFDVYIALCAAESLVSFKCDGIWPSVCLDRDTHKKKIKVFHSECCCFWRIILLSIWTLFSWYLSLTSLHMSFHLLRFFVSHNPWSLLRARKLQLKLSQSGTQLRLSGDLRGKEGTRLDVKPGAKSTSCLCAQPNYCVCIDLFDCNWQ